MDTIKKKKTLVVATRILGWKVFSSYILNELKNDESRDLTVLEYGLADTWEMPAPKYTRLSIDFENFWRLRHLFKKHHITPSSFEQLVVIGYSLAVPLRGYINRSRSLSLVTDTTPIMAHRGGARTRGGIKNFVKQLFVGAMNTLVYRPLFKQVSHFFVLSNKVKDSLVDDYHVDEGAITVLHPPILNAHVEHFYMPSIAGEKPVLLFVGNDFERKGGAFLLSVYRRFLADQAALIIVTSDPIVKQEALPEGVFLFRSVPHEQVYSLISQSTLFLFPTYRDELGLVLSEALKMGTPVVARLASAQDEFVKHDQTGLLLSFDSGQEEWGAAIQSLLQSPERLERYKQFSLELAGQMLEPEIFRAKLASGLTVSSA